MMDLADESEKIAKNFISKSQELVQWLHVHAYNLKIPNERKTRLATSCFCVALDHHQSIVLLASSRRWASAFSLVRIMVEAYAKGVWIAHHASREDVELLVREDKKKDFGEMVRDIETDKEKDKAFLSLIKSTAWPGLNKYVHTGMVLLSRYYEGDRIEAKFSAPDVVQMLHFVNSFGLLVGHSMNAASGNLHHVDAFERKTIEYNKYYDAVHKSMNSDS